jgi:hypothetical protein
MHTCVSINVSLKRINDFNDIVIDFDIHSNVYRMYCARGGSGGNFPATDIVTVTWPAFLEFLSDFDLVDETSERCRMSDMDTIFVAANVERTDEEKRADNSRRSLTRFEFLECIFRIAINKYMHAKPPRCATPAEAIEMLMTEKNSATCTRRFQCLSKRLSVHRGCQYCLDGPSRVTPRGLPPA